MTPGLWTAFLIFGAGACAVTGLVYVAVAGRSPRPRLLRSLGVLAAVGGVKALAEWSMYSSTSAEAYGEAMRWQLAVSFAWAMVLVWFLSEYADGLRRPAAFVAACWAALLVADLASAHGIAFERVTEVRSAVLPWGEIIAIGVGPAHPLRPWLDVCGLALAAFSIAVCLHLARRRDRREAALVALALGVLHGTAFVHAALVDQGLVDLPYLVTPAIFVLVALMASDLARRVLGAFALGRAVRANEQRWKSLLAEADLLIAGLDRDGRIDFANPRFARATGHDPDDLAGVELLALFPDPEGSEAAEAIRGALRGEAPRPAEGAIRTRDGGLRSIVWTWVRVQAENAGAAVVLVVGSDITERRHAEEARDAALREAEGLRRRLEEENVYLREEVRRSDLGVADVAGESEAWHRVLENVEQVAGTDATVLIQGETGVGKEVVAQAIHDRSPRKDRPFVRVNCASLTSSLIETELFGHEAGAFTGAVGARHGRFAVADGGTLFLDEVGELPLEIQPKLLRVLQSGEFERVGSSATRHADVRVLAASNRDLAAEVAAGGFRQDLFFRLNVYPITVPPLRERPGDVPALVRHYVPLLAGRLGRRIDEIPGPVMASLAEYDWPGNVRELLNVLERAIIVSPGPRLRLAEPLAPRTAPEGEAPSPARLEDVERGHIQAALERSGWRVSGPDGAARALGLNPSTLRGRMRKLGLKRRRLEL